MRSGRSDLSWFLRAARVVPVIAGAALLGGMIGGFAMFAIDSALTWEPNPQSRPDARAENQASAVNPQPPSQAPPAQTPQTQTTKPARIVGGAIPDPSAGMSGPPPVQQQQRNAPTQSQTQQSQIQQPQTQVSPQLLTGKPLGPAAPLQQQTATTTTPAPASATPPQNQSANQPQNPTPVQTQKVPVQTQKPAPNTSSAQQQTHWPDALSRAHQNAATPQQQTAPSAAAPPATANAPPATGQTSEPAGTKKKDMDRKDSSTQATASTDDRNRPSDSRRARQSRRQASRNGGTDQAPGADYSSRRQQARSYDRLYDSYGNRRDRSYGNTREQSYGDRDDQDDTASQYGRDTRNRGRSRVIGRRQPDESDRTQAYETPRARPEPFWGGGFFRRGYQDDGD
jgi:hypothetical protein